MTHLLWSCNRPWHSVGGVEQTNGLAGGYNCWSNIPISSNNVVDRRHRRGLAVCNVSYSEGQRAQPHSLVDAAQVQQQLTEAAAFGDIDACLYLLNHDKYNKRVKMNDGLLKKIVSTCYDRHLPDKALLIVQSLQTKHPKYFSILMKECLKKKDLEGLDRVLEGRRKAGFEPDSYTHTARITALGATRQSVAAVAQLRIALRDVKCRTVEVFNAAISACGVCKDWAGAEHVWLMLEEYKVEPDIVTYNSMIKAAGVAGRMEDVKKYYYKIVEGGSGLKATARTFTSVFSAASSCKHSDALWLMQVYKNIDMQPNDFILSSFFSAMSFADCTRQEIDLVFDLIEESRRKSSLNDISYTSFLMFLARQDMPERAVDIWNAAQQDRIYFSPHFFSAFFTACSKEKSIAKGDLYQMALEAFDNLNQWWMEQDPQSVGSRLEKDALTAYNAFLHFLGEKKQIDLASLVFESMNSQGPLPDVVTYNTMLHILGKSKEVDAALTLYWEMTSMGIEPTEKTVGSLIHAFASVGDADAAQKVFESLLSSGIKPNVIMYTSLINATVRHGSAESLSLAFELAQDMERHDIAMTDVTYGCLFLACEKLGDVNMAFKLYRKACEDGIRPSDEMHNILISVCTKCGKMDEALDLVKKMSRENSKLQQHTMNSFTRALSVQSPIRAVRMMSLMKAMGMQPSRSTRLTVLKECSLSGDVIEALGIYQSLLACGMDLDGSSGSALICSLCQAQQLEEAVKVYDQMMIEAWMGRSGKALLPKRAHVPDGMALSSLAQSHAAAGLLNHAWKYYMQLKRRERSLQRATVTHRRLFEALIEGYCRRQNLKRALLVFDDWKSASAQWCTQSEASRIKSLQQTTRSREASSLIRDQTKNENDRSKPATDARSPNQNRRKYPKLSYVTLAYLEASCRKDADLSWRVYDVMAVMRAQKETKLQSELARPPKASHHVATESSDS